MGKYKLVEEIKDDKKYYSLLDVDKNLVVWSENEDISMLDKILVDYLQSDMENQSRCILWSMMLLGKDSVKTNSDEYEFGMDMVVDGKPKHIVLTCDIYDIDDSTSGYFSDEDNAKDNAKDNGYVSGMVTKMTNLWKSFYKS